MSAPKPVVLVVDDDNELRALLVSLVEAEGCEVLEADNAEVALEIVSKRPPALALLDIDLPGMSGIELCEKLRADDATANIKILMLTGSSDVPRTEKALAAGADTYITKPAEPAKLTSLVRDLLGGAGPKGWLQQKRK